MVVSFDLLEVLNVIETIFFIAYMIITIWNNKMWGLITQLIFAIVLIIINVVQLQIEITTGEPYGFTIAIIITWLIGVICLAYLVESKK